MSDSEGSVMSLHGSEKSVTHDETTQQDHNGDKIEEYQNLLQSMIITNSASEEEEQAEEEDNANEKKIVGKPHLLIVKLRKRNSLKLIWSISERKYNILYVL